MRTSLALISAAALGITWPASPSALAQAPSPPTSPAPAATAAPATTADPPPLLLRIDAKVDGIGKLVFTRQAVWYEKNYWDPPSQVIFAGEPWPDVSSTPAHWLEMVPSLDLAHAWITARDGRDVVALEQRPYGFDLYLCDSPDGAADYHLEIAIPRLPAKRASPESSQVLTPQPMPAPASAAVVAPGTPPPLWLGDPGVDPLKARAAFRERFDAALAAEKAATLAAYDRAGTKNPAWDDDVRRLIALDYGPSFPGQIAWKDILEAKKAACVRAYENGCTDPWVIEVGLFNGFYAPEARGDELARFQANAEHAMAQSDYPALQKFLTAARAVHQEIKCRRQDAAEGDQNAGNPPTYTWPAGTDSKAAFQQGWAQLQILVQDPSVALLMYGRTLDDFLKDARADSTGTDEVMVPLGKFLEAHQGQDHPTYAYRMLEARYWINFAWAARGTGYANTVTEEGSKLFGERLEKAKAVLQDAWHSDPGAAEAPTAMLTVLMGLGAERAEMETWFRRAMDVEPNSYAAGLSKMLFLDPKWGGSWDAIMEFGQQCYATQDWDTRMPMLLMFARRWAFDDGSEAPQSLSAPEVWADVQKAYTGALANCPALAGFDHTGYALCAAQAQQWKIAHEQFEMIVKPDDQELGIFKVSPETFRDLRQQAAEHAAQPESGAP